MSFVLSACSALQSRLVSACRCLGLRRRIRANAECVLVSCSISEAPPRVLRIVRGALWQDVSTHVSPQLSP
ncbi:hypothetical protein PLICRDRAFT_89681 [Plicaturopsis crispa FD-325 SS-3]|nr:hypothetical protein PLICRDRAFT_89681 [Plicaturopsis crispa FD-325 SS-3]